MIQRKYTFQDIYDYLKEFYDMDWKLGKILADEEKDGILKFRFGSPNGTGLRSLADVFHNGNKEKIWLEVSNENLKVSKYAPRLPEVTPPKVNWQDFYTKRHEAELTK